MRFIVAGKSMEPAYLDGDRVLACRVIYKLRKPRVGEVVVLKAPKSGRLIIKRIYRIKGDEYFVIGDNLNGSTDSREFGPVSRGMIIGGVSPRHKFSIDNKCLWIKTIFYGKERKRRSAR